MRLASLAAALFLSSCLSSSPGTSTAEDAGASPGADACQPASCASAGKNCGSIPDGCGGTLSCGSCSGIQTCGGGGSPNRCGASCTPGTCGSLGKNCGTLPDGCGGTLTCGSCSVSGESCGAGGKSNVCGAGTCTPTTCLLEGKNCGSISDGCSTTLSCGACTVAGEVCAGAGIANVCGKPACVPTTCAAQSKNCGLISDGCGKNIPCGSCTVSGESCGAGGTPNVCGKGTCVPTDCLKAGKNCDDIPDGCGGTVACGSCSTGTCGGGGTPNVCGGAVPCKGCPTGYTCNGSGVCAGGSSTTLLLDVKAVTVSGTVTMNGKLPFSACSSSDRATVTFEEKSMGVTFSVPVPCSGATSPFAFTSNIFPGTYEVRVRGGNSDLPQAPYLISAALAISANTNNLAFDVKSVAVGGVVTMNGQQPTSACSSSDRGSLSFEEKASGVTFTIPIPCNTATTPFSFSGTVFPGSYTVRIRGGNSNLPQAAYLVTSTLTLNADNKALAFDVKSIAISGVVTMNGTRPSSACSSSDRGTVTFEEPTQGVTFSLPIPCNGSTSAFGFSGTVFPGTYKVRVRGGNSSLPQAPFLVTSSLALGASTSTLAFDVKSITVGGVVTMNGKQPTSACSSSDRGTVVFEETASGVSFSLPIPCNTATTPFGFTGTIFPGSYTVRVRGGNSSLPQANYLAATNLALNASSTSLAFDVKSISVDGTVTLNGKLPFSACSSSDRGTLTFSESASGVSFSLPIPCNSATTPFTYTGSVFPGTYAVRIRGGNSELPQASFLAAAALGLTANTTRLDFDVKSVTVSGTVTLNGSQPTSACSSSDRATVLFTDVDTGVTFSVPVPCNGATTAFTFTAQIFPGTYSIRVRGGNSSLPQASYVVAERIKIP